MTKMNVDICKCCDEIWTNCNMKHIQLGKHGLSLCPDCYAEYIKSFKQKPISEREQDHTILKAYSDGANDMLDKIVAEIIEEKDFAYADFEQYKVEYLGVDAEYVEDELPQDDFRYGMERAIEIIDKYRESEDKT